MSKDFSQMSYEDLKKKEKGVSIMTGLLTGLGMTLVGLTAYQSYTDGAFDSTMIIGLCCLAALPFTMKERRSVLDEIAKREKDIA